MKHKYTCPAEKPANEWLAENGLCAKQLLKTELVIQQAQIAAHNMSKHHADLLTSQQASLIQNFIKAASHYNTRIRLQKKHGFKILNISTAINRKLFKQHRQLNKH
jgi:hypothetical protein